MVHCIFFKMIGNLFLLICLFAVIKSENPSKSDELSDENNFFPGEILEQAEESDIYVNTALDKDGDETDVIHVLNETEAHLNTTISRNGNETDSNATASNATQPTTHHWPCQSFNMAKDNESLTTVLFSNETGLARLLQHMNASEGCAVLLFYSPYCKFSMQLAPLYNAIGRSYKDIVVAAIDVEQVMNRAARYGVFAIPTMFFFYAGKPVGRFNRSKRTSRNLQHFVHNFSGFYPAIPINITSADEIGPLPTELIHTVDYNMVFSVGFLILYTLYRLLGEAMWILLSRLILYVKSLFTFHQKTD